jgi:hypothetical protein
VSAGGARRGRRDNGLDATEYAVAGDVDPRVGEHLLDLLAAGGIAAYLQPSADLNPVTRTTTVPSRPVDRLYVDRTHLATARDHLRRLTEEQASVEPAPVPAGSGRADVTAGRGDPDIDAEWARIVAGYHLDVADGARPWPTAENLGPDTGTDPTAPPGDTRPFRDTGPKRRTTDPTDEPFPSPAPRTRRRLPYAGDISGISIGGRPTGPVDDGRTDGGSLLDGLDSFGSGLPDGDEERYVPPPPPPLPRLSKYAVVGIVAMVAGFAIFLFPHLLPMQRFLATALGFTGIVAGFVMLISRLRPGDEEDDDPADGAVV